MNALVDRQGLAGLMASPIPRCGPQGSRQAREELTRRQDSGGLGDAPPQRIVARD
jgi:hypothetical protein